MNNRIYTVAFLCLSLVVNSFGQRNNCDNNGGAEITVGSSCSYQTWNSTNNSDYWDNASGCGGWDGDDVWGWFYATSTSTTITYNPTDGIFDPVIHLFSGGCNGSTMTSLACADDNGSGGSETITYATTIGTRYRIRVQDYWDNASYYGEICVYNAGGSSSGCSSATSIASLPYNQTGLTTSGAGDDFSSADVCGSSYMNGDDYVFEYTPASDECITVTLSNTSTWVGVFVTEGCPDDGASSCVAYNTNSSGNPSIPSASLTGGTTYYITVSTYPSPQTTPFDIDVQTVTCPVPPSNDDCSGATALTVNPDDVCTSFTSSTITNATASSDANDCFGSDDDDVWFSFVATSTVHNIDLSNITGSVTDMYHAVFTGTCGSLGSSILCSDANSSTANGLTIGQTYYIRVYTYTSTTFQTVDFDICVTTPTPVPGQDCTQPVNLCNTTVNIGDPGYSGTGGYSDFTGTGNCTGGELNSMWLQIDIAATGDLNFTIMPNDGSNTSNGTETDYDFLLWRMSGSGTTTDCSTIGSSSGTALEACNYSGSGVTGVASGGNAPSPVDSYFDDAFEPTVSATAGDVFYLVIQNYSSSTSGFTIDLSNSGAGVVDYTPPTSVLWTAGTDSDWTDPDNWGNCSVYPACGVDATITGSLSTQPIIPANGTQYVEDLTINSGGNLTLGTNATLHVCGDFVNNGTITFDPNSTIIFDGGSATQTISGVCTGVNAFGNFQIDKTGGSVVLADDIEIDGNFDNVNGTSIMNLDSYTMSIEGDLTNFDGDNTFTAGTGTVAFIGSASQDYDQGSSDLNLNNVTMNNTGAGVNLITDMNLGSNGVLDLTDGVIVTSGFEVNVTNDADAAIVNHTNASYVEGNLVRAISSLGDFDFPVGHSTQGYQLANVDFTVATTIATLTARFDPYSGAAPTQGGTECSTTYNIANQDNGYWTIEKDLAGSVGEYDITLYPTGATNTGGASGWTVCKKPDISTGTWALQGTCSASSTVSMVRRTGITSFSVFAIAQSTVPLPIELLEFTGEVKATCNELKWTTASEINSNRFELMRSSDGNDFEFVASLDAQGNSSSLTNYVYNDCAIDRSYYYKLISYDNDGAFTESVVVYLERNDENDIDVNVVPNPNTGVFSLYSRNELNFDVDVRIFDATGRLVDERLMIDVSNKQDANFDISSLAKGMYSVVLTNHNYGFVQNVPFIKQ